MIPPLFLFALATLTPVPLIAAAALQGGVWVWGALAYLTVFTAALDGLVRHAAPAAPEGQEFPAAKRLSVLLAVAHFALLACTVAALGGRTGLTLAEKAGLFAAAGLFFGQVSNANAHELIHRTARGPRRLGTWVYISLLFGHHASAHGLIHHRHVGTDADPNSARLGEGFWRFVVRAWRGSFIAGFRAETARRRAAGQPRWRHPYGLYLGGAAAMLGAAGLIGGGGGPLALLALAAHAQIQLLLSDYVQHYGLRRALDPGGRPEPIGPQHSWNAPQWFSGALMLNAPRHSDHHAHPARPFPALELPGPEAVPTLPHSLPVMACLALFPRAWRAVMDPRVARWSRAPEVPPAMAAE